MKDAPDQSIPVLAMTLDPRLRRLFALVGVCLDEGEMDDREDALYDIMLALAPEYLPPDESDAHEFTVQWREMVDQAIAVRRP